MSSRIPLPYNPKIIELFRNPKNMGPMKDPTITATAGSPACGDMISLYLKIEKRNNVDVVINATFESYGCAANIAAASILTEMIKGKSVEDAWKISWRDIADELGGLPVIKYHCSILAVGALRRAIRDYYKKIKIHPNWLPRDLTIEEKQTFEEEKMMEHLRKMRESMVKYK